jgi:2-oxo-3-hexenedioate decarboxylase
VSAAAFARELLDAFDAGATVPSVAARWPGMGWPEGYQIAAELVRLRRARGERTVGRKIGFTNKNIWAQYGATAPIWAHVYDRSLVFAEDSRAAISLRASARPRLEPELAFRLARPLAAGVSDPERVLEACEWVAPSFELVDCHFADWRFQPAESVADFALHWRLVVGTPHVLQASERRELAQRLADCEVVLKRDGVEVDRGVGANALGHPAGALAHLTAVLARSPDFEPLAAGEIVTTGTLTAAMPVRAGERWSSELRGLPLTGLSLTFSA